MYSIVSTSWKKLEISLILTSLLCLYLVINSFLIIWYLINDSNQIINKYYITSNIILYSVLVIHSLNIYKHTMSYKNLQNAMVSITLVIVSFIHTFNITFIGYISADNNMFINIKYIQWMYLVYTIVFYVFVTQSIKKWITYFDSNNIVYFIGNHFIKNAHNKVRIGTTLLIVHTVASLIMLNMSFVLNLNKVIYYVTSVISTLLSIVVVYCEHKTNAFVNNIHRASYIATSIIYIVFVLINYYITNLYKADLYLGGRELFFEIQGVMVILLVSCCLIFIGVKIYSNIRNQINVEANNVQL